MTATRSLCTDIYLRVRFREDIPTIYSNKMKRKKTQSGKSSKIQLTDHREAHIDTPNAHIYSTTPFPLVWLRYFNKICRG